jgi:hypothetical protein
MLATIAVGLVSRFEPERRSRRRSYSATEEVEVSVGITVVLPLLIEDHMNALPNGVLDARMTGGVRWDANPFELCRGGGSDRLSDLVHTLPS